MTPLGRPVDSARGAEGASSGLTRLLGSGKALYSGLAAPGLCTSRDAGVLLQ